MSLLTIDEFLALAGVVLDESLEGVGIVVALIVLEEILGEVDYGVEGVGTEGVEILDGDVRIEEIDQLVGEAGNQDVPEIIFAGSDRFAVLAGRERGPLRIDADGTVQREAVNVAVGLEILVGDVGDVGVFIAGCDELKPGEQIEAVQPTEEGAGCSGGDDGLDHCDNEVAVGLDTAGLEVIDEHRGKIG